MTTLPSTPCISLPAVSCCSCSPRWFPTSTITCGSKIKLYTRCCGLDDANQHNDEAVFITLCDTCYKIYGETYANLHMRDFWNVYDEYKDVYPLGEKEGELRKTLKNTFCGSLPQEHVKSWFEEWKKWSLNSTEKD